MRSRRGSRALAPVLALLLTGLVSAAVLGAGEARWTRQFGTAHRDEITSVAVDRSGNVYVAGFTEGDLGRSNLGDQDAFVRKYTAGGKRRWTRQFGTGARDVINSVAVDRSGNVYVAGSTEGSLGRSNLGDWDAFVRTYTAGGKVRWTRQFGSDKYDAIDSVVIDGSGNVYVAGSTEGALPGQSTKGGQDAFVRKYTAGGKVRWTRQFGTDNLDFISSAAVDGSGNVYVAGFTEGDLGRSNLGREDAFVRKYTPSGQRRWTRQFGSDKDDAIHSVAVDRSGNVYVAGFTEGDLSRSNLGNRDAFVRTYTARGKQRWTRQFGTALWDVIRGVAVDGSGNVYVAGFTEDALPGQSTKGGTDAFARKYTAGGRRRWTRQFGSDMSDLAAAIAATRSARVYVAGLTFGALPGKASKGDRDAFVRGYKG
jgi:hypothetical protein